MSIDYVFYTGPFFVIEFEYFTKKEVEWNCAPGHSHDFSVGRYCPHCRSSREDIISFQHEWHPGLNDLLFERFADVFQIFEMGDDRLILISNSVEHPCSEYYTLEDEGHQVFCADELGQAMNWMRTTFDEQFTAIEEVVGAGNIMTRWGTFKTHR